MDSIEKMFYSIRTCKTEHMKLESTRILINNLPNYRDQCVLILSHLYSLIISENYIDRVCGCKILQRLDYFEYTFEFTASEANSASKHCHIRSTEPMDSNDTATTVISPTHDDLITKFNIENKNKKYKKNIENGRSTSDDNNCADSNNEKKMSSTVCLSSSIALDNAMTECGYNNNLIHSQDIKEAEQTTGKKVTKTQKTDKRRRASTKKTVLVHQPIETNRFTTVNVFFELIFKNVLDSDWNIRHGSILAYVGLLSSYNSAIDLDQDLKIIPLQYIKNIGVPPIKITITGNLYAKLFEILKNDKFYDFEDNITSSPVRDAACILLKHLYPMIDTNNIFTQIYELLSSNEWQEQFSALLALSQLKIYLIEIFEKKNLQKILNTLINLLETSDDDVKCLCANLLVYLVQNSMINKKTAEKIKDICWDQIEVDQGTTNYSAGLLDLFIAIHIHFNITISNTLRPIYPFYVSLISIVKESAINFSRLFDFNEIIYLLSEGILLESSTHYKHLELLKEKIDSLIKDKIILINREEANSLTSASNYLAQESNEVLNYIKPFTSETTANAKIFQEPDLINNVIPETQTKNEIKDKISTVNSTIYSQETNKLQKEYTHNGNDTKYEAPSCCRCKSTGKLIYNDDTSQSDKAFTEKGITALKLANSTHDELRTKYFHHFFNVISLDIHTPYEESDFLCYDDAFFTYDGIKSLGPAKILNNRACLFFELVKIEGIQLLPKEETVLSETFKICYINYHNLEKANPAADLNSINLKEFVLNNIHNDFEKYSSLQKMPIKEFIKIINDFTFLSLFPYAYEKCLGLVRKHACKLAFLSDDFTLYFQLENSCTFLSLFCEIIKDSKRIELIASRLIDLLIESDKKLNDYIAVKQKQNKTVLTPIKKRTKEHKSQKKVKTPKDTPNDEGKSYFENVYEQIIANVQVFFNVLGGTFSTFGCFADLMKNPNRLAFFKYTISNYYELTECKEIFDEAMAKKDIPILKILLKDIHLNCAFVQEMLANFNLHLFYNLVDVVDPCFNIIFLNMILKSIKMNFEPRTSCICGELASSCKCRNYFNDIQALITKVICTSSFPINQKIKNQELIDLINSERQFSRKMDERVKDIINEALSNSTTVKKNK